MLLHDTMLMKDSFCSGTSDTPLCHCGKAKETVAHFLLNCENYEKERKVMMETVMDFVDAKMPSKVRESPKKYYWHQA